MISIRRRAVEFIGVVIVASCVAVTIGACRNNADSNSVSNAALNVATAQTDSAANALPSWLLGTWTREWINRRGTESNTLDVHYLQTPSIFADVRFPRDRGDFSHARSFDDLSDEELSQLARQRGFTGHTTVDGLISTWHHELDFQPPDSSADIGRIARNGADAMFEHALDSSYTESWKSTSAGANTFLVVRIERAGRLQSTLIVTGDDFVYVRNRAKDLPSAPSLDSLIASTQATRAQIIEYLDCEFSVGRVRGGTIPWEIQHSTLPWREKQRLDFVDGIMVAAESATLLVPRAPIADSWSVPVNTISRGDLLTLFVARKP